MNEEFTEEQWAEADRKVALMLNDLEELFSEHTPKEPPSFFRILFKDMWDVKNWDLHK